MTTIHTTFVPADLDASTWCNLEPLYQDLIDRPVDSPEAFEAWVIDRSELDAAASEARANIYIRMTCHTDDAEASGAWTRFLDDVPPRLKPVANVLDRRYVELAERFAPGSPRYAVLTRATRNDVELYHADNVPLETDLDKLDQQYDKICGAQTVEFDGETRTLPQMARELQHTDRAHRERAWRAVADRRLADRDPIDQILDEQIALRHRIARNAGFDNFRDYQHQRFGRFDYTPADCMAFHEAVEKHAVPFMRELDARRREALSVDTLRPWDLAVDERARPALRPFEGGQQLIEKTRAVFDALDPALGALFRELGDDRTPGGCLDLDSRTGKASGGYQYMRDRSRTPFIFMNAAGVHGDVETMVHEAGHAFHSQLCRDEPILAYRHSDIEFAEVASMTQELLTMPHWDAYYDDPADVDRARREQLEGSIAILPWIATIDAFQHWIYTNPTHSRDERTAHWRALDERFGHAVDWSALTDQRDTQWQRQSHLFGHAFYYIEYGIAQLGALGIWLNALDLGVEHALSKYKHALALGGSRPLPELFEAAGVPLDLSPQRVERLVDAVRRELDKLPE